MKVIDELIELARLAGSTQAKRGYGVYTQDDAIMERAFWEGVEARAKAIRDEVAALKAERDVAMKDAERYRWCVDNNMVLSGGSSAFCWPIAPVGRTKWDRYIDAAIAKAEGDAIKKGG